MNNDEKLSRVQSHHRVPKKKKHIVRNVVLGILAVLIILTGVFALMAFNNLKGTTSKMYQKAGTSDSRNASSLLAQKKPVSILILGTDTGALGRSYKGRTDTMMIMTLNPKKHQQLKHLILHVLSVTHMHLRHLNIFQVPLHSP